MADLGLSPVRAAASKRVSAAKTSAAKVAHKTSAASHKTSRKAIRVTSAAKTARTTSGKSMKAAGTAGKRTAKTSARASGLVARAWWQSIKLAMRAQPTESAGSSSAPKMTAAAIAGAGSAYLLDPERGKHRRHVLKDRALAAGRTLARRGSSQGRYLAGKAQGAVHQAASSPAGPTDDLTLADRVRTEIFRRPDAPKDAVNLGVVAGVVYLRGEVHDPAQIEQLVADARAVPGVRSVENLLHTPGTPAPTGGAA